MNDPGYIAAGYLITLGAVAAYAWSIRVRTRHVARVFGTPSSTPALVPSEPASTGAPDQEG